MAIRVKVFVVVLLHLIPHVIGTKFDLTTPRNVDDGTADGGNAISVDGRKVLLAPQDDGNCIGWMGRRFWDTVKWYFANGGIVVVAAIHGDGAADELNSATNHFNNFFHTVPSPTILFNFYTKRGFKIIPNSRTIGVLVIAENLAELVTFFQHTPTDLVESSKSNFLFIILNQAPRNATESFVTKLWTRHNILNLMIMMPCTEISAKLKGSAYLEDMSRMVGFLDPFVANGESWGQMKWVHENELEHQPSEDSDLWHGDGNFRGYPIKCEIFMKYPTMIEQNELPPFFRSSYIQKSAKTPRNFGGLDALVLGTLADKLNFTIVLKVIKMDFGFEMDNGTVTGTLGDVVYKKTDLSFNNRFVMKYKSDVEFLYAIMTDQFCLFAPKAQLKPKWLAIFKCFTVDVWSLFVVANLICGFVRYGIKRWEELLRWRKGKTHPLSRILFETWNIMMSSPSILLPKRSAERSFVGFCLLMNVIFTGTFQGSLVTSISTPSSYKDMNTMQEVDESGLFIFMPSEGFMDIFGDGGSKVLDSLKSKMRFREREEFERVIADDRPIFISRMSDSTLNIEREYTKPDGTPAYHVVKECPRNYHMSYIVRRGWAFSTLFNTILSRLREAGFINMWYKSTENAILMHKRITDRRENSLKPFNLEDMQTAFFILVLGLTGCTFVFFVELTWKRPPQLIAH